MELSILRMRNVNWNICASTNRANFKAHTCIKYLAFIWSRLPQKETSRRYTIISDSKFHFLNRVAIECHK
jgi:hypothetical protein